MNHDEHYKTSDQGLAAYLMDQGFYCAGTVPDEHSDVRQFFVFVDVPDPKAIEEAYFRYKKEPMSARSYFEKMRTVRHLLKGGSK